MKRSRTLAVVLSAFVVLSAVSFLVYGKVSPAGTRTIIATSSEGETAQSPSSSKQNSKVTSSGAASSKAAVKATSSKETTSSQKAASSKTASSKVTSSQPASSKTTSSAASSKNAASSSKVTSNSSASSQASSSKATVSSKAESSSQNSSSKTTEAKAEEKKPEAAAQPALPGPEIKSKSVILCEASTGRILYEKNSHEKLPPASITKVMTELLTLEAIESGKLKWTDTLTCSAHAASMGGSDIWLAPNEQMSVKDLFKAMSIASANDAAVVFAEKIGGSEQGFVAMMNNKAKSLGMNDTHFVNANGLDADGHLTSAHDIMLMSRELIKHKQIFDFCTVWMDSLRGGKTALNNTNKMIRTYSGINGLKTGSTGKAGYCVSATAQRDGMQLIAVTMGSDNSKDRFATATNLLNYGFGGWSLVKLKPTQSEFDIRVQKGAEYNVTAKIDVMPSCLVQKGKENSVTQKVSIASDVEAPVIKGQVVGKITLFEDGKAIGTVPIKATKAVEKMNFGIALKKLFSCI